MALPATEGRGISVEVESLLDAAARLEAIRGAVEQLTSRHTLFAEVDSGTTGNVEAAGAIRSFLSRWSYGLACLRSDVASLATAMRHAAAAYQRVEADIVAGAGG